MIKHGQGHRSSSNDAYVAEFVEWINSLGISPGAILGSPQMWRAAPPSNVCGPCASGRREEAEADLDLEDNRGV
jgi:hypothetical protein